MVLKRAFSVRFSGANSSRTQSRNPHRNQVWYTSRYAHLDPNGPYEFGQSGVLDGDESPRGTRGIDISSSFTHITSPFRKPLHAFCVGKG